MVEKCSGFRLQGEIMKRTALYAMAMLLVGCLLTACASNDVTLVNTWKNPAYPPRKCAKVLVAGVSENYGRRMLFEDAFTQELKREGVNALQSYLVLMGPDLSRELMKTRSPSGTSASSTNFESRNV